MHKEKRPKHPPKTRADPLRKLGRKERKRSRSRLVSRRESIVQGLQKSQIIAREHKPKAQSLGVDVMNQVGITPRLIEYSDDSATLHEFQEPGLHSRLSVASDSKIIRHQVGRRNTMEDDFMNNPNMEHSPTNSNDTQYSWETTLNEPVIT